MPEFLVSAGLWVIKIIKFMQGKGPFLSFPCTVSSEFFLWKMLVILLILIHLPARYQWQYLKQ